MSVEMGLLPPDTVIERKSKKRKKGSGSSSRTSKPKKAPPPPSPSLLSLGSSTRPADSILRRDSHGHGGSGAAISYKEVDEDDDDFEEIVEDVAVAVPPKKKSRPKAATASSSTSLPLTLNPETSLDVATYSPATRAAACLPMTVHWDPDSPDGRKVGWRVWIPTPGGGWRHARVHRYDPHTHKHYVVVGDGSSGAASSSSSSSWIWLRNTQHQLRVATRIVWAHVKGYAWWPALVMESVVPQSTTRDGFLWLEFFGTGETSTLRDADDCVRPFDPEQPLDPIVAKHRKKRNQRAFQLASQEFATILRVRNAAAVGFAQAALNMAVARVPKLVHATMSSGSSSSSKSSSKTVIPTVGQRVRIFRSDVNYPYGDTVTGVVRQFSPAQRKWLVSFEESKYPAIWLNLLAKEHTLKILDNGATIPGPDRVLPFLFGYVPTQDSNEYAAMLNDCCHACTQSVASTSGKSSLAHELTVVCSSCEATYHVGCVDPPIALAQWQRMARDESDFVCSRCTVCRGCYQKDIAFGSHPHPSPPPNVKLLDGKQSLPLCVPCREHYEKERYCPNCAHVWDDTKYYLWRKEMPTVKLRQQQQLLLQDAPTGVQFGAFGSDELPLDFKIDPKLFYPETSEWGYTEDDMLVCDGCNVWLHASCSGLTPKEYNATSNGKHPIYSVEFLCYMCCRARCRAILQALQDEDRTMLFAVPVSEKDVPNYYDLIKEPMDLQTMTAKVEVEESLNYVWVREDFELMVLNALRFNRYVSAVRNWLCSTVDCSHFPNSTRLCGAKRSIFTFKPWKTSLRRLQKRPSIQSSLMISKSVSRTLNKRSRTSKSECR